MSDHRPSLGREDGPAGRSRSGKRPARSAGFMTLTLAASTVVSVVALALVAGAAPDAIRDVPLLGELMSHRGWVGPSDVARNAPLPGEHDREERPADADPEVADPDRRRATDADAPAGVAGPRTPGREDVDPARPPAAGPVEPGSTPPQSVPDPEDPAGPPPGANPPGRGPIGAYITPTGEPGPDPGAQRPSTLPKPDPGPSSKPDPKPSTKPAPGKPSTKPAPGKPSSTTKPDKDKPGKGDDKPDGKPDKDEDEKPDKKDDPEPARDAGEGAD